MEVNPTICKCTNIKKQSMQRMILFIVGLFADVEFWFLH